MGVSLKDFGNAASEILSTLGSSAVTGLCVGSAALQLKNGDLQGFAVCATSALISALSTLAFGAMAVETMTKPDLKNSDVSYLQTLVNSAIDGDPVTWLSPAMAVVGILGAEGSLSTLGDTKLALVYASLGLASLFLLHVWTKGVQIDQRRSLLPASTSYPHL